jgi:hypothetical protein
VCPGSAPSPAEDMAASLSPTLPATDRFRACSDGLRSAPGNLAYRSVRSGSPLVERSPSKWALRDQRVIGWLAKAQAHENGEYIKCELDRQVLMVMVVAGSVSGVHHASSRSTPPMCQRRSFFRRRRRGCRCVTEASWLLMLSFSITSSKVILVLIT